MCPFLSLLHNEIHAVQKNSQNKPKHRVRRFRAKSVRFCHSYIARYMPFKKIHRVNRNTKWGVFRRKASVFVIYTCWDFCVYFFLKLIVFTTSKTRFDFVLIEEFLCFDWYCTISWTLCYVLKNGLWLASLCFAARIPSDLVLLQNLQKT